MSGRLDEAKWFADFVISEANLYRSRDFVTVAQGMQMPAGTLMNGNTAASAANAITSILMQPVDSRAGTVRALVLARDAEVNDAYIVYGSFAAGTVNTTLAGLRIYVRPGVLAQSIPTPAGVEGGE